MRKVVLALALLFAGAAAPVGAQEMPLRPRTGQGLTVTPAYEGWYENGDGTLSLSFGYHNRNLDEVVEIPLGPRNHIEPAEFDGFQPTRFEPQRHYGVFAVRVPADFDPEAKIYWTLEVHGQELRIPGHVRPEWKIDAIAGEAGSGNTPPVLTFEEGGQEAVGPAGALGKPRLATVGQPIEITVWAHDDGRASTSVASGGREAVPVALTWFEHQGPGAVVFGSPTASVPAAGGSATTTATFEAPGEYVLRVRANDASGVATAGHAQCCWTNGFLRVTVSP
jgi:hypothetical protein